MTFELVTTPDFLLYLCMWGGLTTYCFNNIKTPLKIQEIEDSRKREKTRSLYVTNYCSLIHAMVMVTLSKISTLNTRRPDMLDCVRPRLLQASPSSRGHLHEDLPELLCPRHRSGGPQGVQRTCDERPPYGDHSHPAPLPRLVSNPPLDILTNFLEMASVSGPRFLCSSERYLTHST